MATDAYNLPLSLISMESPWFPMEKGPRKPLTVRFLTLHSCPHDILRWRSFAANCRPVFISRRYCMLSVSQFSISGSNEKVSLCGSILPWGMGYHFEILIPYLSRRSLLPTQSFNFSLHLSSPAPCRPLSTTSSTQWAGNTKISLITFHKILARKI